MFIACPGCTARLDIPNDKAGNPRTKVMCPGCQRIFRLEEAAAAAPTGALPQPRPPAVAPARPPLAPAPPPMPAPPSRPAAPMPTPAAAKATESTGPHDDLVELDGFGMGLEEVAAPDDGRKWEVDRLDYAGTTLSLEEIRDLIKRGWLHKADRIRPTDGAWALIRDHSGVAQALAFRQKAIAQKLAQMARKSAHPCENHAKKKASHICLECARAFCGDCGNDCDGGTILCLDCDAKMVPV